MTRSQILLSTALGLTVSFGAAQAGPDASAAMPVHADPAPLHILPPGLEPESLGADDGLTDPGDGEGGEGGENGDGETCSECGSEGEYGESPLRPADPPENPGADNFPLGTGLTTTIVNSLTLGGEACSRYNALDRIDCLRDELARAARSLPRSGEYAEMRRALETASAKLDQIVVQNVDRTAPVVRYRAPTSRGDRTSVTPIRRIAPQNVAQANAQAVAVMEELQTTLLRSASSSARRQVHFERAAQAVDSMKVLLRST